MEVRREDENSMSNKLARLCDAEDSAFEGTDRQLLVDAAASLRTAAAAQSSSAVLPSTFVAAAWDEVHAFLPSASTRVDRVAFVHFAMSRHGQRGPKSPEYYQFLNHLFDSAVQLMLPKEKTDLGKHCFGYAAIFAEEFYFGKPRDILGLNTEPRPLDGLAGVRAGLDADWAAVSKDEAGRVTFEAFKALMCDKHQGSIIPQIAEQYNTFLSTTFKTASALMLPNVKTTLGGHCFKYAALMAAEFYFGAARELATGSGSSSVADVLDVTGARGRL